MQPFSLVSPILFVLLGGFGFGLGVPPLPETPTLAKIAPERCLFYLSLAGVATPDPKSPNQTEQLLAEPEVQKLGAEIEKLMKANISKALGQGGPVPGMSGEELADLVRLVLGKPLAVYVSDVQMGPGGPTARAGIVIKLDDDLEKVKAKLSQLTKLLPPPMLGTVKIDGEDWQTIKPTPQDTIVWGFQKKYFQAAWGEGEMESLVKRARGESPAWLTQLRKDVPIERVSTIGYLNVKKIRETFAPMGGPQAAVILEAIGLNNINAVVASTGLDQTAYISKVLISLDGQPQGLLQFATIKPLSAADLASIPADANVALAVKINPLAVFDAWLDMVGKTEPQAKTDVLNGVAQMEGQFGLKLHDEVLKPLGDSLCLSASLGAAGVPDVTAVLQVKDSPQAAKTLAKLMQLAEAMLAAQGANNTNLMGALKLTKRTVEGKDVYVLQSPQPMFPQIAWCLTDKELVVSTPPGVQSYLSRPATFKSLTELPEVARMLSGEAGPTALLYCDVRGIFEKVYPMLSMVTAMLQQQGVSLNLPAVPPANTIAVHLTPLVSSVRQTKAGIELTERSPLPGLGLAASAPLALALPTLFWQMRGVPANRGAGDGTSRQRAAWYIAGPGSNELAKLFASRGLRASTLNHTAEKYDRWLPKSQPGATVVLLFTLDRPDERIPEQYRDLLPMPWDQIEAELKEGRAVERAGKAREWNIVLLAAPTVSKLKELIQTTKIFGIAAPNNQPAAKSPLSQSRNATGAERKISQRTVWFSAGPAYKELNEVVWSRGGWLKGFNHGAGNYENILSQSQPGSTVVLLFAFDHPDKNMPAEYQDLLPVPWDQIETALKKGETVERAGKAREREVVLLAAPTESKLKELIHSTKLLSPNPPNK